MALGISGMLALVNMLGGLIFGYNTGVIAGAQALISATGKKWGIPLSLSSSLPCPFYLLPLFPVFDVIAGAQGLINNTRKK
jgi:hypothetical protein